jgi:hypothetical protein
MSTRLKSSVIQLVEEIENEQLLETLRDFLQFKKANSPGKLWNELPKENQEAIFLSLEEAKSPDNLMSREEFLPRKS